MTNEVTVMPNVFDIVAELQRCTVQIDMMYLRIGALLAAVKDNRLYESYAEHTKTMSAFLQEIDIGIGVSQVDHYIRVWRTFGDHIGTRRIPFKRLLLANPLVNDERSLTYWLDQAEQLPYRGFKDAIAEGRGKTPVDGCDHPADQRKAFFKCLVCGAWIKEDS